MINILLHFQAAIFIKYGKVRALKTVVRKMKFGSLVDCSFTNQDTHLNYFTPLLKKHNKKQFGSLESPNTSAAGIYDGEISYKVFLAGKSGVGKTSCVTKLSGNCVSSATAETSGIQVSCVYWPVRIVETGKVILFKLSIWDAGELMLNTYHHILPSCKEGVDCIIYMFSLASKSMWEDIPRLISRIDAAENVLKVCVGTHEDLSSECQITNDMIYDFQQVWKFPIIKFSNSIPKLYQTEMEKFKELSLFLNKLCELLWYRDQVKAGLIQKSLVDFCFLDDTNTGCEVPGRKHARTISRSSANSSTRVTFC